MTTKTCKGCGNKIPRKIPGHHRKTKKNRKYCYNCSPLRPPKHRLDTPEYRSEKRRRKAVLIKMRGGCCKKCGYNKSITALSFHHRNPKIKKFDISNGNLMLDWDGVIAEAKKCDILCLNCHAELHNDPK